MPKPDCITLINYLKHPLFNAVLRHLLVSAQIFSKGGSVCNFLIHPSVRKAIHSKFEKEIQNILEMINNSLQTNDLKEKLKIIYNDFSPQQTILTDFETLYKKIPSIIKETRIIVMNGDTSVSSKDYSSGNNIIIGGNTLGRGVTFPKLQTIYYTRTAKNLKQIQCGNIAECLDMTETLV